MAMKTDCSDMEILEQAKELIYRCIPTHFTALKTDTGNAIILQMKEGEKRKKLVFRQSLVSVMVCRVLFKLR